MLMVFRHIIIVKFALEGCVVVTIPEIDEGGDFDSKWIWTARAI